jgi:multisubunit Na+/H+ antiporter MnhF subunit
MENILMAVLYVSLVIHIVMMAIAVRRIWRGENVVDRLIGADLLSTLTLAVFVLIALIWQRALYLDVALALAALGFVGTIAYAKFIADEQLF